VKIPESLNKESTHMTSALNTLTLTGISVLWGVMLGLISPWWMIASILSLFAGYGNEVKKRDTHVRF